MSLPVTNSVLLIFQVQRKQKEITALKNELGDNEDRVHAMSEHLKNVRQELQHTQVHLCTLS